MMKYITYLWTRKKKMMFKAIVRRRGFYVQLIVLEQDEALRNRGLLFEGKDMDIRSSLGPALNVNTIYIRGTVHTSDHKLATLKYHSFEEAEKYRSRVVSTLMDWGAVQKSGDVVVRF